MATSKFVPLSFFMFCMGDFATKLSVPTEFVEDHGLHLRRQLTLHLKTAPERGSWAVKIKKIKGIFYIADGWSDFVKDNNILDLKFLVFYIVADSTLNVSIFGQDSLLELPDHEGDQARTWRFVKKLKDYNITDQRLDIPKAFVIGTNMAETRSVQLVDWRGRKWEIRKTDRQKGMFALTCGWSDFLHGNKLEVGDILLFEFVANNVMKVVFMEEEAGERLLARARYGGFIP